MARSGGGLLLVLGYLANILISVDCECLVPPFYTGDWYSIEQGTELNTIIKKNELRNELFDGTCSDTRREEASIDAEGRFHSEILFYSRFAIAIDTEHAEANWDWQSCMALSSGCYKCWKMFFRTPNVLQYSVSSCHTAQGSITPTLDRVCSDILPQTEVNTMFKKTLDIVNCKTTFEGVYHFSYEVNYGGGGICDSPHSHVIACQEPGSPYVDNQVMVMNFGMCPDVSSTVNRRIRFQCMGTWVDVQGNVWSAMADLGRDVFRERFRCMLTRNDQQRSDNKRRHTMSRWADCSTLKSPYDGDIRLILLPVVYGSQLVQPGCNLPRNFTGSWFTTGEFDTHLVINATHIYYKTKLDEFTYRETYFTCQQNRDSRFLMTAVTVGKCEVDYVCFDFVPRHHNIIRWRMGKPYRMAVEEMDDPLYLHKKFRQACSWYSFTLDRTDTAWTYQVYILNPPAPVECPIAGRYKFKQIGSEAEKYITRVRGITVRPRHQIDCRIKTSELKSCATNTKKIFVDVDYCDTVDHTGRPIGEYDIEDRELSCVGFWMEDMRSYMITYDEEDAISRFRCWVYERLDWRDIVMSRSTRALCGKNQRARSFLPEEGASLSLELKESERLFDDCPQRYNDGSDPYRTELKVYVMGGAAVSMSSLVLLCATTLIALVYTR